MKVAAVYVEHPQFGPDDEVLHEHLGDAALAYSQQAFHALYPELDERSTDKPALQFHFDNGELPGMSLNARKLHELLARTYRPDLGQALLFDPETAAGDPLLKHLHRGALIMLREQSADPFAMLYAPKHSWLDRYAAWLKGIGEKVKLHVLFEEPPLHAWCLFASANLRMRAAVQLLGTGLANEVVRMVIEARRLRRRASNIRDEALATRILDKSVLGGSVRALIFRGISHEHTLSPQLVRALGPDLVRFGQPTEDLHMNMRPLYKLDLALALGDSNDEQLQAYGRAELLYVGLNAGARETVYPEGFERLTEAQVQEWFDTFAHRMPELTPPGYREKSWEWYRHAIG